MRVPRNAFLFCKFTITFLVWFSFIFQLKELLLASFILLLSSAILTIRRAPLIFIYSQTVERFFESPKIDLHMKGIRFAHIIGALFSGIALIFVYMDFSFCWWVVLGFALLKTVSTAGFCPGEKLYKCMKNGGCCRITRGC